MRAYCMPKVVGMELRFRRPDQAARISSPRHDESAKKARSKTAKESRRMMSRRKVFIPTDCKNG